MMIWNNFQVFINVAGPCRAFPKSVEFPPHLLPFFVRQAAVLEKKRSMAVHHLALWHWCGRLCPASGETCWSYPVMKSYDKFKGWLCKMQLVLEYKRVLQNGSCHSYFFLVLKHWTRLKHIHSWSIISVLERPHFIHFSPALRVESQT